MVNQYHPDNVQIEVTEDCNHSCFYCYNHWRTDDPSRNKMTQETASQLVDVLRDEVKPFDITITGGEPLMNMSALTTLAKGIARPYGINTNLSVMNSDRLEKILEANSMVTLLVSIPSLQQGTFKDIVGRDRLQQTLIGLKTVIEHEVPVYANMVVHKLNVGQIYETGKILQEEYNVNNFCVTPVLRPAGKKDSPHYLDRDEMIKALETTIELKEDLGINVNVLEVIPPCFLPEHLRGIEMLEKGCSAGRTTLQINYKADARVCTQSPFEIGNLFTDGFRKIWDDLKPYRENKNVPEDCLGCYSFPSCGGGCRFEGFQEGDPINRRDSRMREPIQGTRKPLLLKNIDFSREYHVKIAMCREEPDGTFTLYNGKRTINVNQGLRDFILGLKDKSRRFRVEDYSEDIQPKAKYIGMQLLSRGFLE